MNNINVISKTMQDLKLLQKENTQCKIYFTTVDDWNTDDGTNQCGLPCSDEN